jgi:hypothetical protein
MAEHSEDSIFGARAVRALKRRYSDIVVHPEVIPGLTLSYTSAFTGRFRGNHKFWLVGVWPGILGFTLEQINNLSDSIKNIHASFVGAIGSRKASFLHHLGLKANALVYLDAHDNAVEVEIRTHQMAKRYAGAFATIRQQ